MATKPTPGGSDGTWGTDLNAHLAVSLASDGKIKDGAVLEAATESGDGDRTVADKAYVDDLIIGSNVGHDSEGGFNNCDVKVVGGATTKTKVYTKYFTGTISGTTVFAHGISSGATKIFSVSLAVKDSGAGLRCFEMFRGSSPAASIDVQADDSNITLGNVGTAVDSQIFRVKVDYVL